MAAAIALSLIVYGLEVLYRKFDMFFKSKRIVVPEIKEDNLLSFDEWRQQYWTMSPAPLTPNRTIGSPPLSRVGSAPAEIGGLGGQRSEERDKWKIYHYTSRLSPRI